jgi:hypothetical protein
MLLLLTIPAAAHAVALGFSTFSGPPTPTTTIGSQWRFDDVSPGVDMLLTLDHIVSGSISLSIVGDDLLIELTGDSADNPTSEFTASFVAANTTFSSLVAFDFTFRDLDDVAAPFDFYERLAMCSPTSFAFIPPTDVDTSPTGCGYFFRSDGNGDTNPNDKRAWARVYYEEPVSGFQFGWAFIQEGTGAGVNNRGCFLDGNVVDWPNHARSKTATNITTVDAYGIELVLDGARTIVGQSSTLPSNQQFQDFADYQHSGKTFLRWTGPTPIPPGATCSIGYQESAAQAVALTSYRTIRWLDVNGAIIECVKQIRRRDIAYPVTSDVGVSFISYSDDTCLTDIWVSGVRVEYFHHFVRVDSLTADGPRDPFHVDLVSGSYLMQPGGTIDIPVPSPPIGARYRLATYLVSSSASNDPFPTRDFDLELLGSSVQVPLASPILVGVASMALAVAGLGALARRRRRTTPPHLRVPENLTT